MKTITSNQHHMTTDTTSAPIPATTPRPASPYRGYRDVAIDNEKEYLIRENEELREQIRALTLPGTQGTDHTSTLHGSYTTDSVHQPRHEEDGKAAGEVLEKPQVPSTSNEG